VFAHKRPKVKRKSLARLKSDLWNRLRPEVDLATLANDIRKFLRQHVGESARNVNAAHNLARYLTGKYSVSRKWGDLNWLIDYHPDDLDAFLDRIDSREFEESRKKYDEVLRLIQKKSRVKPQKAAEAEQSRKKSKIRYDWRRRLYRQGLIIKQFGRAPSLSLLDLHSKIPPESPCLDILLSGEAIRMAGHWDSFENLFGEDRHRFPKSLRHERSGRTKVYYLNAFIECLIHLLANRDGGKQWLPQGLDRGVVLRGIIERANRFSPEIGDMLAEKLRPYLP